MEPLNQAMTGKSRARKRKITTTPMMMPSTSPMNQSRVPVKRSFSREFLAIRTRIPRTTRMTMRISKKDRMIQAA